MGRRSKPRPAWRRRRVWLPLLLLVLLAAVAVSAARYYLALTALLDGRNQVLAARQELSGDISKLDAARLTRAQADLLRANTDFGDKSELIAGGWLAGVADHLPWLSTQVDGARGLRSAGQAGIQLGLDVVQLARDVVPQSTGPNPGSPLQRLVQLASKHPQELTRAAADVTSFQHSLEAMPTSKLFGPLENARVTLLTEGAKVVSGAGPTLHILQALPAALGQGTHSYLLLLENPGEERPSGGYIGAVGVVTFTDGAIASLSFRDSGFYTPLVRNIAPPPPLAAHLFGSHPWELDDANWSADFPTAMADVERFYSAATGQTVDGDVSIDPVALSYILGVTGPAHVPPYPQVLTSANVLKELNYITNKARPSDPGKVFLAPFGELMTRRLLDAPIGQMTALATALQHGAVGKHVVAYFHNPSLQALVDGAGFAGRLTTPTSDSVFVDDANLSGTKGDLFVGRTMDLVVKVGADGNAQDQLTLTYTNPKVTNPADRALLPFSGAQYRDYLRVYLPETARLSGLTVSLNGAKPTNNSPESITYEFGQQAVAYWFIVPVGATERLEFTYSGPFADISVSPETYQLQWIKQVNSLPWPVNATVTMPDGRTTRWSATLDSDKSWSLQG